MIRAKLKKKNSKQRENIIQGRKACRVIIRLELEICSNVTKIR